METIGDRIKKLRKEFGLSQQKFGETVKVSKSHISNIELGGDYPSEMLIKLICMEFHVNEAWLKEGTLPMYVEEIESLIENTLWDSNEKFNKLLGSDNPLIRMQAAQLMMLFSEIINIDGFSDEGKLLYLKMCEKLLYDINKVLIVFRKSAFDKQLSILGPQELAIIFDDGFKTIMDDLKAFGDFFYKKQNPNH
jgi:transcriptional regulator with XRE-family HTH domain